MIIAVSVVPWVPAAYAGLIKRVRAVLASVPFQIVLAPAVPVPRRNATPPAMLAVRLRHVRQPINAEAAPELIIAVMPVTMQRWAHVQGWGLAVRLMDLALRQIFAVHAAGLCIPSPAILIRALIPVEIIAWSMEDGQLRRRLVQAAAQIILLHKPSHAIILLRKTEGAIVLQTEELHAPYPVVLAAPQRRCHVLSTPDQVETLIRQLILKTMLLVLCQKAGRVWAVHPVVSALVTLVLRLPKTVIILVVHLLYLVKQMVARRKVILVPAPMGKMAIVHVIPVHLAVRARYAGHLMAVMEHVQQAAAVVRLPVRVKTADLMAAAVLAGLVPGIIPAVVVELLVCVVVQQLPVAPEAQLVAPSQMAVAVPLIAAVAPRQQACTAMQAHAHVINLMPPIPGQVAGLVVFLLMKHA